MKFYRATPDGYVEECSEDDPYCLGKEPGDHNEDAAAGFRGGILRFEFPDGSTHLVRLKHDNGMGYVEPDHAFEGLTPDEPCAHPDCGKRESTHRFTPPGVHS